MYLHQTFYYFFNIYGRKFYLFSLIYSFIFNAELSNLINNQLSIIKCLLKYYKPSEDTIALLCDGLSIYYDIFLY